MLRLHPLFALGLGSFRGIFLAAGASCFPNIHARQRVAVGVIVVIRAVEFAAAVKTSNAELRFTHVVNSLWSVPLHRLLTFRSSRRRIGRLRLSDAPLRCAAELHVRRHW